MSVAIAEHVAAGQDVHVLWLTCGEASGTIRHRVTGLTPGNDYKVDFVFRSTTGSASAAINKGWLLVEPSPVR